MTRVVANALAVLLVAAAAEAHVTIRPRESKAGATEKYTVRVPTEGKVATTSVELQVPDGVTISGADSVESVNAEMKRANGRVVSITWTVTIEPGQNREFTFTATNPPQGTEIAWKAHQRYADGTSSDWTDPAGGRRPAPVTKLTAATGGGQ